MATEMELDNTYTSTLKRLNQEYVEAYMNSDVEWYEQ